MTHAASASSSYGITSPTSLPLVAAADFARVYGDSKTVVDRPLRAPPADVAAAFSQLGLPDALAHPEALPERRADVAAFLDKWTGEEGTDLQPLAVALPDPPPGWLPRVAHPDVRRWALHLHSLWGALGRQISPAVQQQPELHTLLWVPHPFVVPGARFREVYYWDSYWVLKGLLVSGLLDLAEGIVNNLVHLVESYGHVPNGIRSYYINRSQPPLLSEMVRLVHEAAPCQERLTRWLDALLAEHAYWTRFDGPAAKQVSVPCPGGQVYQLARYCADWDAPRPESYREDVETGQEAGLDEAGQRRLWRELASGAESGWDFSSRWLADGKTLATMRTTRVVPTDLNAFLYQMERNIGRFAGELGRSSVAAQFCQLAQARREAINALMWDATSGQWHDLLLSAQPPATGVGSPPAGQQGAGGESPAAVGATTAQRSSLVAASNWVPLFAGVAEAGSQQAAQAVAALRLSGLVCKGGLAATTVVTGQQWDFPNVWPPLVDMAVVGAAEYGGEAGRELAAELAQAYLGTAYTAWSATGQMFEKFNALEVGAPGGGGEYEVVAGFGWTNGVALSLLDTYGWRA